MPLSLDYRPQTLDYMFGNVAMLDSLKRTLERDNRPHTYMFTGPSGCGKTTLARIVANMLGCSEMDRAEYNISDLRGIDAAREIINTCKFEPLAGDVRVIILNECHKATNEFQNAMLEILEEPPKKVYFLLCTTEPEKLLKTVRTRASIFHVSSLSIEEMIEFIDWATSGEDKPLSEKVRQALAEEADGCPRKALVILDQILGMDDEEKQLVAISDGISEEPEAIHLCKILLNSDPDTTKWKKMSDIVRNIDKDKAESVRYFILGYMTNVLLGSEGKKAQRIAKIMAEFTEPYFNTGRAGLALSCYMATLS